MAFLTPAVTIYAVFTLIPLGQTVFLSLQRWNGVSPVKVFVGAHNYAELLGDHIFAIAVRNTLIWVIIGSAGSLFIALTLALLSWGSGRLYYIFRTVYFMPQVLPLVVVGIVWSWIYNPYFGALNTLLGRVGLGFLQRGWLGDPTLAVGAVLVASIWATVGLSFVIFSAALNNVSVELLDAAKVDGASGLQRIRHVVIPQLAHAVTLVASLLLITNFQVFDIVWIMTSGGPADTTQVLATYMYRSAFSDNRVGYGAAQSMVLTAICLLTTIVFIRLREKNTEV